MVAGVSLLALMPGAAQAENAAAESAAADNGSPNQLTDIVVNAERTKTSLQNLSASVSAIGADALKEANITDITGLNGSVPGLVVARSGGAERIITIRGIGSETPENTNTQPGVSYHVDGVYIFNSIAANAAFIDVDQVEVLRGPQGTMFGQGSTGGTINVVSRQPKLGEFSGNASVGIGNYNLMQLVGGINIPLGNTIALRFAGQSNKHDGYAHATDVVGRGRYELDDEDNTGWKASLLWEPTSNFSLTLSTIQYNSKTNGPAQKNILDPNSDPRTLTQDYPGRSMVKTGLYYGVAKWDLPFATLKSISSYQTMKSEQAWDADGLTSDLFYALTYSPLTYGGYTHDHVAMWKSDTKSYTQEINLSHSSDRLDWIVGGVYLHSKNSQYINEFKDSGTDLVQTPLPADTAWDDPLVSTLQYAENSSVTREAWAAYFQGTYSFTPSLSFVLGGRYNHDKYTGSSDNISGGQTVAYTSGSYLQPSRSPGLSTGKWTGKAALQYKLSPANMIYASYTRGFKPGGLNSSAANASYEIFGLPYGIKSTYKPETVDSFELGSKNRFLDNTAQFNASAFYYIYKNMQFLDEDGILYGKGTANAPSAYIYGLEMETSWLADDHWKVEGSMSALKGKFDKDYYALDPAAANAAQDAAGYPGWLFWTNYYAATMARDSARANINGNDVPKLPGLQGTAAISYTNEVGPGELTAKLQYLYRGKFKYRLFSNSTLDDVPSYSVVNLFFRYNFDEKPYYLSLAVTNLFDKAGINSRFSDPYGSAQTFNTYIAPRQAVFTVGVKF